MNATKQDAYLVWDDGDGERYPIEAESPREAAEQYVGSDDVWIDHDATRGETVRVHVESEDGEPVDSYEIAVNPPAPECDDEDGHAWITPVAVVGGCNEAPGVMGCGGRDVVVTSVCAACGCGRHEDQDGCLEYREGEFAKNLIQQELSDDGNYPEARWLVEGTPLHARYLRSAWRKVADYHLEDGWYFAYPDGNAWEAYRIRDGKVIDVTGEAIQSTHDAARDRLAGICPSDDDEDVDDEDEHDALYALASDEGWSPEAYCFTRMA